MCDKEEESQEHSPEKCEAIHHDDALKVTINNIFDMNPENLKSAAKR